MNLKLALIAALLMGSAISCSQDQPAASSTDAVLSTPAAPPARSAAPAAPGLAPAVPTIDAPPKDARYTIYCLAVTGPEHTARANQVKLLWQQATGRRDWYVIHQDDQSLVYFGYYRSISDPKDRDTARSMADRKMIQNLKDTVGDYPFEQAMLLPLDAPDPTAPPQWNLVNAKGAWTLEIAVYRGAPEPGSPDRKTAAVDAVRKARAMGIEAYYYHGPSASSVCIGAWPQEAVRQENLQNGDPNQALTVVPDPIAAMLPQTVTDAEGNPTQVVHAGAKIVDQTLLATQAQYPTHSLNGYVDMIIVSGHAVPRESSVVAIPHTAESSTPALSGAPAVQLLGGGDSTGTDASGGDSSGGRLRSLGQ